VLDESPIAPCSTIIAGRYDVARLIGQGSMARVYAARDLVTGGSVAIKILSRRYADSERERARFFREARAALQIKHPNVVKVLDVGRRVDGRPFIVIEYLQGESLGECVRRRGRMPLEVALRIVRDAARGLRAVHEAGIVHRDVKPDNIFLVGESGSPTGVRLVDFGLAKLHAHTGATTHSSITLGTAAYMPPEQVLSEEVDARADVYALGVVFFRVLTGHLPFESQKDLDMLAQQVLLQPPPASWIVEGLDQRIDLIVQRALRKNPSNRYPSMAQLLEDLTTLIGGNGASIEQVPLVVEPDEYMPTTDSGKKAALLFCGTLGIAEPGWVNVS
jgi:serine/threonine-protein kinase